MKVNFVDIVSLGNDDEYLIDFERKITVLLTLTDGSIEEHNYQDGIIPSSIFKERVDIVKAEIGDGITEISARAFDSCTRLTAVTLPNTLTTIGTWAFDFCSSLKSVNLPNSVTSLGKYAFESCFALTSVTLSNSLTEINYGAFYYCNSLTSVVIPNGVTTIGIWAFNACTKLSAVTIPDSVTTIGENAFASVPTNGTLTCSDSWYEGLAEPNITNLGNVYNWKLEIPATVVHCSDGDVSL